jgi:hypothetical protein
MSEDEFRFNVPRAWAELQAVPEYAERGPTQSDLAERLSISKSTLISYLNRWPLDLSDLENETT